MRKLQLLLVLLLFAFLLAACGGSQASEEPEEKEEPKTEETAEVDEELESAKAMFQPLGEIPVPEDNEMTDEKIELGKKLFFDPRLSGNNELSCASCHAPGLGWGDNRPTFVGFEGAEGTRNSPTVINAGYYEENFWDGRAGSLEEQATGPITSEVEMNQDLDELVEELKAVPEYVDEFENVFNDQITADNIAKAIAAFERTIVITDTAFDQFLAGDDDAISDEAKEGMKLFVGKAQCITCHSGALLSDQQYHNLGIEGDEGRFAVTGNEEDKGAFKTPGLRGVKYTAPYMHDGSLETLEDVIKFYNDGGGNDPNKSELIKPLGLTDEEIGYLVAFLESMSGEEPTVETPTLP